MTNTRLSSSLVLTLATSLSLLPLVRAESAELPRQLNLGSLARTVRAPQDLSGPVSITNGKSSTQVTPGMLLTPAQAVAVQQVLNTGSQSIVLGAQGNAVGGNVFLPAAQPLTSLRVPQGVTVLGDFAASSMAMTGNLINAGTIYAYTSNPATTNASIFAQNINNHTTGLISSVIPAGMFSGVNPSNLSLSLIAQQSIINNGTITSAANLNIVAPNQVANLSTGSANAVMSALGDLNIITSVLNNSGVLRSDFANVNIATQLNTSSVQSAIIAQGGAWSSAWQNHPNDLSIYSSGGTIQALLGSINVATPGANSSNFTAIAGGDWLAENLNLKLAEGKTEVSANRISGLLNIDAGCAVAGALTGDVQLGEMNITGDPTFFSNALIQVNAPLNFKAPITIFSGTDILITSTITSSGFPITLVAGANITAASGTDQFPNQIQPGKTISVSGPSASGGDVNCSGCVIDSASSTGNGGKIQMAAFTFAGNGGRVVTQAGGFARTDSSFGQAGDITVIAPGIVSQNNLTFNANGAKGSPKITVTGAQPTGKLTADSNGNTGSLAPGAVLPGGQTTLTQIIGSGAIVKASADSLVVGKVDVDNSSGNGGTVELNATSNFTLNNNGNILASGGTGALGKSGGNGGNISIKSSFMAIGSNSSMQANGGNGGPGANGADGAGQSGSAGGKGGAGGAIEISSGVIAAQSGSLISANGGFGGQAGKGGTGILGPSIGGAGGNGGAGGSAGKGGSIKVNSTGDVVLAELSVGGGGGGAGGDGGFGANSAGGVGGKGGNGGATGSGAPGGTIDIKVSGFLGLTDSLQASGGNGGNGGDGSIGGTGSTIGGAGGNGGVAGSGAAGGKITINGGEIQLSGPGNLIELEAVGGFGSGGLNGGIGGIGPIGGAGGNSGKSGNSGAGGTISLTAGLGGITVVSGNELNINADGQVPVVGAQGGNGGIGTATLSGKGGNGGGGGNGGKGGAIIISAPFGQFQNDTGINQFISASGSPGSNGGGGGDGGSPVNGTGGEGGKAASGGNGAPGGTITVNVGNFIFNGQLLANGGNGGSNGGGGDGGSSVNAQGGKGGPGANGGTGAGGGKISINFLNLVDMKGQSKILATGGNGGQGSSGGAGGTSKNTFAGAAGGSSGNGGNGANGGTITMNGGFIFGGAFQTANFAVVSVGGGNGGIAIVGGDGSDGITGGAGGNGGNGGKAANAGTITINTGSYNQLGGASQIIANGGLGGNGSDAGAVGNGTAPVGKGISGGKGGSGGPGGNAGTINIKTTANFSTVGIMGLLGGDGGDGGDGGNATKSDNTSAGGAGGAGGNGALGGKGGTLSVTHTSDTADSLTFAANVSLFAGDGGLAGDGGGSNIGGTAGGVGGNGGTAGAGGAGGVFKVQSNSSFNYGTGSFDLFGGQGGGGGNGGPGGTGKTPGNGGNAGAAGAGGAGGTFTVSTINDAINNNGAVILSIDARGGDSSNPGAGGGGGTGDNPGKGGAGGNGAPGGKGGTISLSSKSFISTGIAGGAIDASGGGSVNAGAGGAAGTSNLATGKAGIAGTTGGKGSTGGAGGKITLNSGANIIFGASLLATGGLGGGGGTGGKGSQSTFAGFPCGPGGTGGSAGGGGAGGSVTVTTTGANSNINTNGLDVDVFGGDSGTGGNGGAGGSSALGSAVAGKGGTGGNGNLGGKGGTVLFTNTGAGLISLGTSTFDTSGGFAGAGGTGGNGGTAAAGTGGDGGTGGNGASGSNGGNQTFKAAPGNVDDTFAGFNLGGSGKGAAGLGGIGNPAGGVNGGPGQQGAQAGKNGVLTVSYADDTIETDGALHGPLKRKRHSADDETRIANEESELKAVGFVQPVTPLLATAQATRSHLIHSDKKDLTATIDGTTIHIARGAMVVVAAKPGEGFTVFCLHEGKSGDVEMLVDDKRVVLHSSEQVMVRHQSESTTGEDLVIKAGKMPALPGRAFEPVAIRNLHREDFGKGELYLSQFSIPSAISHFHIDQQLKSAGKEKELASILKNAAVVHTVFSSKGPFKMPN